MLILIVEGLTCICTINDILVQISMLKRTPESLIAASANIVFIFQLPILSHNENPVSLLCITVTSQHFLFFFHITVKSKCWMEKMSTTNYCQLWSQSLRKTTRPPPLPPFLVGLSSVRAEPYNHVSR